jgi:hypothetical protein
MREAKPTTGQWIHYTYGGRLPDECRDWVLRDNAGPTWLWRQLARVVVQATPFVIIGFLLLDVLVPSGVTTWFVVGVLAIGLAVTVLLSAAIADVLCTGRLVEHGFPPEAGPRFGSEFGLTMAERRRERRD